MQFSCSTFVSQAQSKPSEQFQSVHIQSPQGQSTRYVPPRSSPAGGQRPRSSPRAHQRPSTWRRPCLNHVQAQVQVYVQAWAHVVLQCRCVAVSELVQTRARLGVSSKRQFKCHATTVPVGAQGRCVTANLCLHVRVGMDVNLDSIFTVISALSFAYAFPTTSLAPAFAFAGSISTPNRTFKPKSKPASRFGP